jgi:hypothetical protein
MVAHPNLLQAMESSHTVGRAAPPLTVHFLLAMMTKKTVFSTR